jgi:hypothetical protein
MESRTLVASYRRELVNAGFIRSSGLPNVAQFVKAFNARYSLEWQTNLLCSGGSESGVTAWIRKALNHGYGNTIQHLLLIRMLGMNLSEFTRRTSESLEELDLDAEMSTRLPSTRLAKNPSEQLRALHRQQVLDCIKENPSATRNQLVRHLAVRAASWPRQYDREWLESVLPAKTKSGGPRMTTSDWHSRDIQLSSQINMIRKQLFASAGRPVRVTRTRVLSELGFRHGALPEKLPLTNLAINSAIESIQEVAVRRVLWLASNVGWTKRSMTLSRVIQSAGVRAKWRILPEFTNTIRRAEELLGRSSKSGNGNVIEEEMRLIA